MCVSYELFNGRTLPYIRPYSCCVFKMLCGDAPLVYLEDYKVLVCRLCKHAVLGVALHLQRFHLTIPLSTRQKLAKDAEGYDVCTPETVTLPRNEGAAIPEIELHNGLCCMQDGCDYTVVKEGSMIKHAQKQHSWTKAQGMIWEQRHVQVYMVCCC